MKKDTMRSVDANANIFTILQKLKITNEVKGTILIYLIPITDYPQLTTESVFDEKSSGIQIPNSVLSQLIQSYQRSSASTRRINTHFEYWKYHLFV
jgi:hypothetical protein